MSGKTLRVAVALALFALCSVAGGDILKTRDGRSFEGLIVSEEGGQVVFEAHKYGSKIIVRVRRSNVASLEKREFTAPAAKPPQLQASEKSSVEDLPPEPPAPPVEQHEGKVYCVIPLFGDVGKEVSAEVLQKSLADAVARKATVVVLHVDSNGGLVQEVEGLVKAIREHRDQVRIVAVIRRALSAAAITAMACPEIYMEPSSMIGAATAFRMTPRGTPMAIQEKMQSVWRAMARSSAETGGHNPLLAEAMIDAALELHATRTDGAPVVEEGSGGETVSRRGRLLTLTSAEAVSCGLADGVIDELDALGAALEIEDLKECPGHGRLLAEHRKKTIEKVEGLVEGYQKEFNKAMGLAEESAPWHGRYVYYRHTGRFTRDSWTRWNRRSRTCIQHLGSAKEIMAKAGKLAEEFPHLVGDPKWLREMEERLQSAQTRLAKESTKRGIYD
jgi:ATP-dependent protease ClpP protease subunit